MFLRVHSNISHKSANGMLIHKHSNVTGYNFQSSDVYQLEDGFQWTQVKDVQMKLPRNTLVEVEFVDEYEGQVGVTRSLTYAVFVSSSVKYLTKILVKCSINK